MDFHEQLVFPCPRRFVKSFEVEIGVEVNNCKKLDDTREKNLQCACLVKLCFVITCQLLYVQIIYVF